MSRSRRWTPVEDDILWFDTLSRLPRKATCLKLPGRSVAAVQERCEELELYLRPLAPGEQGPQLEVLWRDGRLALADVAELLSMTQRAVARLALRRGLGPRPKGRPARASAFWTPVRDAQLMRLVADGVCFAEIDRRLGRASGMSARDRYRRLAVPAVVPLPLLAPLQKVG
jgi:hypothetical protein